MQIEIRNGKVNNFASVIRTGLVLIGRAHAQAGHTIFLPTPDWTPEDGAAGLVPVKVKEIQEGVAVCEDKGGQTWALWLS